MNYTPLIGAYASFFELSVALNFTYAASSQFRDAMKSGLLYNVRKMDSWYATKQKDVISKLVLMSDEDIDLNAKENIKEQFQVILKDLQNSDKVLSAELQETQSTIAKQIKPIYVYVAIFSLTLLFFSGQEVIHCAFPIDAVNTIIFFSLILVPAFYLLTFTDFIVSVPLSVVLILSSVACGLFFPIPFEIPLSNKYLLDIALVIAFLPFVLSALRLFIFSVNLEIKHRYRYFSAYKSLRSLEVNYQKIQEGKEYFKKRVIK